MYVWTLGDIAQEYEVAHSSAYNWTKVWGPETDRPFPEPIVMVQTKNSSVAGWSRKQAAYNPREVRAWHDGLKEAQSKRMSAQMKAAHAAKETEVRHNAPVSHPMREAVTNMEAALEALQETRRELDRLRDLVQSVRPVDRRF